MNEEILERARKDYIHEGGRLGGGNWEDISGKLPSQNLPFRTIAVRIAVVITIPSLFLSGVVGVSQAAKPGEFLYPVKVASEKVVSKLSNEFELKIEKIVPEVLIEKDKDTENKINTQQEKRSEQSQTEIKQGQETRVIITGSPKKQEQKIEKAPEEKGKVQGVQNASEQSQKERAEPERGKSEENKGKGKN